MRRSQSCLTYHTELDLLLHEQAKARSRTPVALQLS
jgi:hypothetical protein